MLLALSFDPIFIYIAVGLSGLIAFARVVLGWAMRD
jgi:Periviscerokinin family